MKFNDKSIQKMSEQYQQFVVHNQEMSAYERHSLKQSDYDSNIMPLASKLMKKSPSNLTLLRGKENQCRNSLSQQNNKNIVTNHSFNGFFNQNTQKMRKKVNESISKKIEFSRALQQSSQVNNNNKNKGNNNFNSSGKLSNFQFITQSSSSNCLLQIHDQVKQFIRKYFPDYCQSQSNIQQQYISINDFVEILFQQFENVIGTAIDLIEEFTDKVFLIFGENVYFGELFERTLDNGLTGLIFQIVKGINEDKSGMEWEGQQNQQMMYQQNIVNSKVNQLVRQNVPASPKIMTGSNNKNLFKSNISKNAQFNNNHSATQKISLNKFFGNTIQNNSSSKIIQLNQQSKLFDESTIFFDENLQQVKKILQDYVQTMYSQAQMKLNKKYSQQLRKITLKHKETQRLLQKVNQKISNHYDSLELQKQYDRKIKQLSQKQTTLLSRLKSVQFEYKQSNEERQKQRIVYNKLEQQFSRIKQKLQRYEQAIFEKAMQRDSPKSIVSNNNSRVSCNNNNNNCQTPPLPTTIAYSPYITRQQPQQQYLGNNNSGSTTTPTRVRQFNHQNIDTVVNNNSNRVSISPIRQRISFVRVNNPVLVGNSNSPSVKLTSIETTATQIHNDHLRQINTDHSRVVTYTPVVNKNTNANSNNLNNDLNNNTNTKLQIGNRVSLLNTNINKPSTSIINNNKPNNTLSNSRLTPTQNNLSQQKYQNNNTHSQLSTNYQYQQQRQHISYSPIKVNFTSSQVGGMNSNNSK